jgi:lysozyme family protein
MADFEKIVQWLLYIEDDHKSPGKIVNEGDGAGLTRLGLTQRWHQSELPMNFFSTLSFADAVKAAKVVYRNRYWNLLSGDQIESDQIAASLMSFAVNDDPLIASKTLQRALGISEDGHIGSQTLAELKLKDPVVVANSFRTEWITFYRNLVTLVPSKKVFLDGWINRANFPYPSALVPDIYE